MRKSVLLVEDNRSDEKLTVRAFRRANIGNDIDVVRDGAEAIEYLAAGGRYAGRELPAVVMLDLKLPKVDGLEVLRRIRAAERTHLLPVVVLTSSKETEDLIRSYQLGTNAYVRKPVDFAEFVEAARTLGLFWLLINQTPPAREGGA